MAWRERDWARFTDAERKALYGAPSPEQERDRTDAAASHTQTLPGTGDRTRAVAWSAVGVLTILVAGLALLARPDRSGTVVPVPALIPSVVYGGATGYLRDGNQRLVCTDEGLDVARNVWVCGTWMILGRNQVAAVAADPGGPCIRRVVDQARRAWTCKITPRPTEIP